MKKVLIFGHSSGLGLSTTKFFLNNNIKVIGLSRKKSKIKDQNLTEISVDLNNEKQITQIIQLIKSKYSDFNALIYCSGILTSHEPEKINLKKMKDLFNVNFFAPVKIETELLKLIKKNEADIVNVTSSVVCEYYEDYI